MEKKKILVVGYGGSGARMVSNILKLSDSCIVDVLNTSRNSYINDENDMKVYQDESLVYGKKYDAVFIAVPTSEHLNYFNRLRDVSSLFILEKPIDSDFAKIESVAHSIDGSDKEVFVFYQKRFLSSWSKAKSLIENQELGAFLYGRVLIESNIRNWRQKDYRTLYAAKKSLGGGVLLTECHEIDFIQWLLGDFTEVAGVIDYLCDEIDVESATHFMAKIKQTPVSFHLNMFAEKPQNSIELYFEKGWLKIDTLKNQISYQIDNEEQTLCFGEEDSNRLATSAYLDYIIENKRDSRFVNYREAMRVNAVCETLKQDVTTSFCKVKFSQFPEDGRGVIDYVVKRAKETFGDNLIAIYGMGSLGYGGYVDGWSDFDIDIIINTSYENARDMFYLGKQIEKEIQNKGFDRIDIRTYNHLQLNERKTILSFGQCSRAVMLIDSAKLIYGTDISEEVVRPDIREMNEEASSLCKTFFEKDENYWIDLPWDDCAAFYALIARFMYSSKTGKVAGKKQAIEYFVENHLGDFPDECKPWFVWAYALRLDPFAKNKLLQESVKQQIVQALRTAFTVVDGLLEKEIREND